MNNPVFKFIVGLLLGMAIVMLVTFNFVLLWVAAAPRSLERITPYIENALEGDDHRYTVKIGETWLVWEGWRHPMSIHLRNVSVLTKEGQVFSTFPEITLGIDVAYLPLGRLLPTSLTIEHPVISLFQNDDKSISFGFPATPDKPVSTETPAPAAPEPTVPANVLLGPLFAPDSNSSFRKLHYVTIEDADVSIGNPHKGVFLEAHNVQFQFKHNHTNVIELTSSAHVLYGDYQSKFDSDFTFDKTKPTIDGKISFTGVVPGALASIFMTDNPVQGVKLPLGGTIDVSVTPAGKIENTHFSIEGGKGTIDSPHLEHPLPIDAMSVEGSLSNDFNDIHIDHALTNIGAMTIEGNGALSLKDGDAALKADYTLKNVSPADIHLVWPLGISPMSREWVTSNVTDGFVPEAGAHIDIHMGDLKKPALPREAVDSYIKIEGAKLRYLPEHPLLRDVTGIIHIDGLSLTADITSGNYLQATKMTNGKLVIADLNADNPHIVVSFDAQSTAKDAVTFLTLPRVNHAGHLNLSPDTVDGTGTASVKVGFDFLEPRDANGKPTGEDTPIDYEVNAQLKDMSAPAFMKKFDIKNGEGTFTVNNTGITFKGKGNINGADASDTTVKYLFKPENGIDTFIDVTATAPVEAFTRFGYPALPFLKGKIGVTANVKEGDAQELSQASFDLTNATVSEKNINLEKPEKEPATFDLTAEKKAGVLTFSSLHYKGKNADIIGTASLTPDLSNFKTITLKKAVFGNNNLESLNYERTDGGFNLDASGASADISGWLRTDPKEPGHFSFEHFPAVQIKADVGHLFFAPNEELTKVKGSLICDSHMCTSADFEGVAGKPFSFRILRNPTGQRQLSLHAEDAGAFLKGTDTITSMEGGDLTIIGNYDDSGAHSVLQGKIDVTEYTVRNAPVLARILSLASFTGFIDSLQGNGIRFQRLNAPFTLTNDVITFDKAKTNGPSIGMTMDGTITMPAANLNLEGTVVPAYSLNSVLGKVPLLGGMLTGGEGQGVFAARYSVKGTESNPSVSVNPLSILTPGFLRGLFDILDTDAPAKAPVKDATVK